MTNVKLDNDVSLVFMTFADSPYGVVVSDVSSKIFISFSV